VAGPFENAFENIIQEIMELNIITTHSWCENVENQSGLGSPILCQHIWVS
jgi:hypothetical protein